MLDMGVLLGQAAAALRRVRHATYRLQLGSALGFDAVAQLGPYLDALGVSDVYLSPCFRSGPGSSHGYDVTDHNAFNPELGSAAAFDRMAGELASRGLGLILDVVPNHLGIAGDANPWWLDVLENGPASPRGGFFDAVPRLNARLAGLTGRFPLGETVWEHTWIPLADGVPHGVYRDRFTGLLTRTELHDGRRALPCAVLFGHFPVALLERRGP